MGKPLFSIITTTYNRFNSGFLHENIASVKESAKSAKVEYEHIIIDDGSFDETQKFLEQLAKKDKRIKYIRQNNSGPAIATRAGLKFAKGEFSIILDDDDLLTVDSLLERKKYIDGHKNVDFFYGKADWIDEYGLPIVPLFQSAYHEGSLYEEMLIGNCINAGTPTTRTKLLKDIKWPEWVNRSQDYFLWLELLRPEIGARIGFIDKEIVRYRYHSNNYTAGLNDERKKAIKAEMNNKIRDLHPRNLVHIAKTARYWIDEAHRTNEYRLLQQREAAQRIEEIQNSLNSYAHSNVVRITVKARNVIRGQIFDRIDRAGNKIKRAAYQLKNRPVNSTGFELVDFEAWDSGKPLVSVVTPFYNRQDTMPDTVHSVLSQTFQDFEYIIVDDGSVDEKAQEYLGKISHEKITIIHQKNQGVAEARNTGVRAAKGKYIVCLDSDDLIEPTYLEKTIMLMEMHPDIDVVTCNMQMFGKKSEAFIYDGVNAANLINDNTVITAAVYRRKVWEVIGGYKSDIGYEDWEFWVNAAENGFKFVHIPEKLFLYRTAEVSRYIDDFSNHHVHSTAIAKIHPDFDRKVVGVNFDYKDTVASKDMFKNMLTSTSETRRTGKKRALIAVPWMTFGGAETLILNYCKEVSSAVDLSFVTALPSVNEWEYKFRELTEKIYHMDNIVTDDYQLDFISYLISAQDIEVLHIVHSGYLFDKLEQLKGRHPQLRIVVTLFNDRAEYFKQSISASASVDTFTSDNTLVIDHYKKLLPTADIRLIPNGVDSTYLMNPEEYDRETNRTNLDIKDDEISVFFVGRLSEEKNPDVFIDVARRSISKCDNTKFYIIGDGPLRGDVERLVDEINSDRVSYLGYKSDVSEYLSSADILILPSSIEGFPLSIIEAMSMEVIPIASRVGGIPDVIKNGKNGFMVTPGSAIEIYETLNSVCSGEVSVEKLKKAARKTVVEGYSNELLGRNYKDLYGVK